MRMFSCRVQDASRSESVPSSYIGHGYAFNAVGPTSPWVAVRPRIDDNKDEFGDLEFDAGLSV